MLEPYTGKREPLRLAVYDLEWIPGTYECRLVGVRDERGYRSYSSVLDFLKAELSSRNRGKVFFAHAGGLADVQFLLAEIIKRKNPNFYVEGSWSGSSLIRCSVKQGEHQWTFADSFWLLRDSLAKIGKSVGLEKLGDDYFCADHPTCGHEGHCIFYAPEADLRVYNERDCEILWLALQRFQDEILALGGKLRQTIASTALTLFRARYLKQTIPTDNRLNELSREAYIASRVEVFRRESGPANYYDVNSSFPHSMTAALPGALESVSKEWRGEATSIVDATVTVEHEIPPIPIRLGGRVFFPNGTFRRRMCGDDLLLVLESGGRIESVHESWNFEPFYDLADYVATIYELRRTTDDPFRKVVTKYLLNSLYGKFGESEEKAELLVHPPKRPKCSKGPQCKTKCQCITQLAPGIYKATKHVEIKHAHVPIGVCVTAKSRGLLTRSMWQSAPYYCDTDSNITAGELPTSDELGAMKFEKRVEAGTYLSPKLYRTLPGPTIRSKGFRKLTNEEFDSLARGEGIPIKRMVRVAENLRGGGVDPRDEEFVKHALSHLSESELKKIGLSARHVMRPKRCSLPDGSTRPWHVSELEEDAK
jgi:hypothetical protein